MILVILSVILIAMLFAPLGCVLLWQRQAYFADGLAHSCLLASSLSVALNLPILLAAPISAIIFAVMFFATKKNGNSAAINLVSSSLFSIGVIVASKLPNRVNLNNLLFGDIISVSYYDLVVVLIITIISTVFLWQKFGDIILLSLNRDLAKSSGVNVASLEFLFLTFLAVVLSITMKMVGALLASSILILPAFSASLISKTPIHMLFLSVIFGISAGIVGVLLSFFFDLPTSPTIVLIYGAMYFMVRVWGRN
ncbi:MAG: metal ABC transporter permease [Rickettsiaceae bacterium]|nr:metal ABC transporter permease [Rickettsiaceae bacterium]